MLNKITLSGLAGSGKTSVGHLLAERLSYEFVSLGNFARELALNEYKMNINEFQGYCEKNPDVDIKIDNAYSEYCNNQKNLVVDYRLGYHFIRDSFNVFLKISENEAVKRLMNAKRSNEFESITEESVRKTMNKRNEEMRQRFIKFYKTDFTDLLNYDLVIETDNLNIFDITDMILKNFKNRTRCTS